MEPRIGARIDAALGDARSVLNVGAGTGSYEPRGRAVLAVEPSELMIGTQQVSPLARRPREPRRKRVVDERQQTLSLAVSPIHLPGIDRQREIG